MCVHACLIHRTQTTSHPTKATTESTTTIIMAPALSVVDLVDSDSEAEASDSKLPPPTTAAAANQQQQEQGESALVRSLRGRIAELEAQVVRLE